MLVEEESTQRPCHGGRITQCIVQPVSATKYAVTFIQDNTSLSFYSIFTGVIKVVFEMIETGSNFQMCLRSSMIRLEETGQCETSNYTDKTASSMQMYNVESLGKFPKTLSYTTFIKYIQLNVIKASPRQL